MDGTQVKDTSRQVIAVVQAAWEMSVAELELVRKGLHLLFQGEAEGCAHR